MQKILARLISFCMKNIKTLRYQGLQWKKQLHFYKVEAIFLNNISARVFDAEVGKLLQEIQEVQAFINGHEESLNREYESYDDPKFEESLWEHHQIKKKVTSLDSKFRNLKTVCKKLTFNNLGMY